MTIWKETKMANIATFVYGYTTTAKDSGNARFLRITDIDEKGYLKKNNAKFVYLTKENKRYLLKKKDVLVARTGATFGKTILFQSDEPTIYASFLIKIILNMKEILPEYYFHFAQSDRYWRQAKKIVTGGGQPQFNANVIKNIKVPIPPLPEQKAIASLLSVWNDAIEKTERLIEAKEKKVNAITQKQINKNCENWKHKKVREIFKSYTSKNHLNEELLSVTQDKGVIPRSILDGRVMSPAGTTAGYKLVEQGDFVISLRSFQGGIEYSNYKGIVSPAYTVLKNIIPINKDFYIHFFKTQIFINKYLRIAIIGIRDGKQVSLPDFETVKIPYPPIQEQEKISSILNKAQEEINILKKILKKYKTQKRGLMQKLLTGKWKVRIK